MFIFSKISPVRFRSGTELFYEQQNNLCSTKDFQFCQIVEASDRTLFEINTTGIVQFFADGDSGTFDDNINNISGDAVTSIVQSNLFARSGPNSARVTPDGSGGVVLRGDTDITLKSGCTYKITGYILTVVSVSSALNMTIQIGTEGWADATLTQIQTWSAATNPTGQVWHKLEANIFVRADIDGKVTFVLSGLDVASMPIHHFDDITLRDEFRPQLQVRDDDGNADFIDTTNSTFTFSSDFQKVLVDFSWANVSVNDCYNICVLDCNDFDTFLLNGTFDDTSSWTLGAGWSIGAGVLTATAASLTGADQTVLLEKGKKYDLQFEITSYTAGNVTPQVFFGGAGTNINLTTRSSAGTFTDEIDLTAETNDYILFRFNAGAATTLSIDNVSILEQDGYKDCSFESECYDLRTTWDCSMLLSWENDEDYCDFDYETFQNAYGQNSFKNFLRVFAKLENPRYPKDKRIHLLSDGRTILLHSKTEKVQELFVDFVPEYLHDALSVGLEHDTFTIEESFIPQQEAEYVNLEEDYEPDWGDDLRVGTVRVNLKKKTPDCNRENNNC